jgi:hypothetical protein
MNHAVNLVGYFNVIDHEKKYFKAAWKIRNSWGEGWGDKGYMSLVDVPYANGCLVLREGFKVNVQDIVGPIPNPNQYLINYLIQILNHQSHHIQFLKKDVLSYTTIASIRENKLRYAILINSN